MGNNNSSNKMLTEEIGSCIDKYNGKQDVLCRLLTKKVKDTDVDNTIDKLRKLMKDQYNTHDIYELGPEDMITNSYDVPITDETKYIEIVMDTHDLRTNEGKQVVKRYAVHRNKPDHACNTDCHCIDKYVDRHVGKYSDGPKLNKHDQEYIKRLVMNAESLLDGVDLGSAETHSSRQGNYSATSDSECAEKLADFAKARYSATSEDSEFDSNGRQYTLQKQQGGAKKKPAKKPAKKTAKKPAKKTAKKAGKRLSNEITTSEVYRMHSRLFNEDEDSPRDISPPNTDDINAINQMLYQSSEGEDEYEDNDIFFSSDEVDIGLTSEVSAAMDDTTSGYESASTETNRIANTRNNKYY